MQIAITDISTYKTVKISVANDQNADIIIIPTADVKIGKAYGYSYYWSAMYSFYGGVTFDSPTSVTIIITTTGQSTPMIEIYGVK